MQTEDPADWTHAQHYAAVTLALRAEPKMVGAASMWNEALTSGLLALREKAGVVEEEGKRPGAQKMLGWAQSNSERSTEWGALFKSLVEGVQRLDPQRHGSARRVGLTDEACPTSTRSTPSTTCTPWQMARRTSTTCGRWAWTGSSSSGRRTTGR